jgi:type I restriction enzyme S subunit
MKEYKLNELVDVFDSMRRPLLTMTRQRIKGPFPYYSANGIIDHINESIFRGEYILVAEDGSVRTEDGHPVVKLTKPNESFWVSNHAHVFRAKTGFLNRYLYYCLTQANIDQCVTGAVQLKVSQENLLNLKLSIHEPAEQQHIVDTTSSHRQESF